MSEPEPRPSWMPLTREIEKALEPTRPVYESWGEEWDGSELAETVDRLLLATGLRAQIEALCSISGKDVIEIGVAIGDRLDALYARLAELEAKP